jgi:dephospho-CoA kinase
MKIAITGSIAGGKSAVMQILRSLGWLTVEADTLSAQVAKSPEGLAEAKRLMGGDFTASEFAQRFACDVAFRAAWEAFIHPRVRQAWQGSLAQNALANVAVELPLVYENKLESAFDKVVVLSTSLEIARMRWKAKGKDETLFKKLNALLLPIDQKCACADFVLINDTTPEALLEKTQALHQTLITHG